MLVTITIRASYMLTTRWFAQLLNFHYVEFQYPKDQLGPSNGQVNEPVLRRGVLVLKIGSFGG